MSDCRDIIVYKKRKKHQDTFKIFDYFKSHHSLLIGCISIAVTLISFSVSMLAYLYQILQLRAWNVPAEIVGNTILNKSLYYIVIVIIMMIAEMILLDRIKKLYIHYYRNIVYSTFWNAYCKEIKKMEIVAKKASHSYNHLKKKHNYKPSVDELNEQEENEKRIKELRQDYQYYHKDLWKDIISFKLLIGVIILLICFLLLPISLLFQLMTNSNILEAIISWILLCCLIVFFGRQSAITYYKPYTPRRIRRIVHTRYKTDASISGFEEAMEDYFDNLETDISLKSMFSDKSLSILSQMFLFSLAFIVLIIVIAGMNTTNTKEFWIYSDNNTQYVVIYQNTETMVLEQAHIDGDQITIHTDRMKYIAPNNCEIQKKKFETVIKDTSYLQKDLQEEQKDNINYLEDSWKQASF